MKIETVCRKITGDGLAEFDEEVNKLLADGWQLVKSEIVPGCNLGSLYFSPCYLAQLVKLDGADMVELEADPITWQDAVWVLRETCQEAKECGPDCPMFAWCQKNLADNNPPASWDDPEELDQPE